MKSVLHKLTLSSLRMNRKRTIVTMIGIMLSAALITAVGVLAISFQHSMIHEERRTEGDFHYAFLDVSQERKKYIENNINVDDYFETGELGYARLEGSLNLYKPYMYFMTMDEKAMEKGTVRIIEGRAPENGNEVIISKSIQSNAGVDFKVGDTLTVELGKRMGASGELGQNTPYMFEEEELMNLTEREFQIVGIMERLSYCIESYSAPGYSVIAGCDAGAAFDITDIYVTYTAEALKNRREVTAAMLGLEAGDSYEHYPDRITENRNLIRFQAIDFQDSTTQYLYAAMVIAVLIIVAASAFCIRNSFAISITEKMKQYGILASVGATPSQIRRNVFYEAFILGLTGIPSGILLGIAASAAVVKIINLFLGNITEVKMIFAVSVPIILFIIFMSGTVIVLSAVRPAVKASHVSPIAAITERGAIKAGGRKLHSPGYIKKLFGMGGEIAYKNMKRNRRKYRVVMASIAVSVTVFVSMYSFTDLLYRSAQIYFPADVYNLKISGAQDINTLKQLGMDDKTQRSSIVQYASLEVDNSTVQYTDKAEEIYGEMLWNQTAVINVCSVGDEEYNRYTAELGIEPEQTADKAILINTSVISDNTRTVFYEPTKYKAGDIIVDCRDNTEVEIAAVTDIYPMGISRGFEHAGLLIVSDEWMEKNPSKQSGVVIAYYESRDPDALQKTAERDYMISAEKIMNIERRRAEQETMVLILSIFLYGFIIVIMLIGISSIFNTITTGMELRSREFAALRSVGMTSKEFRNMISLENLFYGTKALITGLVLGIALSYLIYLRFAEGMEMGYRLPVKGIAISVFSVALILWCIMKYSLAKINRKNIIETIRQENI